MQHHNGSGKLVLTGGMIAKLKQKLKVASKAVTELEELLAGIGSEMLPTARGHTRSYKGAPGRSLGAGPWLWPCVIASRTISASQSNLLASPLVPARKQPHLCERAAFRQSLKPVPQAFEMLTVGRAASARQSL